MTRNFSLNRCLFMTVDPVHIGTGGYRLGRVDAAIAREPGTKLPKIPGTSLHGAARHYAAYRYNKPDCAGQKGHCGNGTCPICYTFGFAKGSDAQGYAGVVSVSDARILFFPVNSMHGPVWVSTVYSLREAGLKVDDMPEGTEAWTSLDKEGDINLGWLMLKSKSGLKIEDNGLLDNSEYKAIKNRLVLVDDSLFSRIVNSNLEVRTSVSIDPVTGAADEGALFTYEAIPRATFLWAEVVVDDYRDKNLWKDGGIIWKCYKEENGPDGKVKYYDNDEKGRALYPAATNGLNNGEPKGWKCAWDVVNAGLEWSEYLGIGGMGTRGFGRLRKLTDREVQV